MNNETNKKNRHKRGFLEHLAVAAELPSDALIGEARVELRGRHTLFMQGCRRILKYSPEEMVIAGKDFSVSIKGERLVCSAYYNGTVTVDGLICDISLHGHGEEDI